MSKTSQSTKIPNGPGFCILRWIPGEDGNPESMRWVVAAYCMNEDEVLERRTMLEKIYPGQKLQTFISLEQARNEDTKEAIKDFWKGYLAKHAS